MRTLCLVALVTGVWVLASLVKVDEDSKWMLALVACLLGLAILRPSWLQLHRGWGTLGDEEARRVTAAILMAVAGIVFGALVGWRLIAVHRARRLCVTAVSSAPAGHAHTLALLETMPIPLGAAVSCSELLDR